MIFVYPIKEAVVAMKKVDNDNYDDDNDEDVPHPQQQKQQS